MLITWHAAVEPAYRSLYEELSLQDVELSAVIPTRWTEGCQLQYFKSESVDSNYEWAVLNTVFVDRIRAFMYPNIFALCRIISRFEPDIIHIIEEPFSVSAMQFTLIRDLFCPNAKIILQSFENIDVYQRFPFGSIQNFNLKRADAIIIVPQEGRNIWETRGFSGKIYNVPLGINVNVFHPLEKPEPFMHDMPFPIPDGRSFKVGYIGRLAEGKGLGDLIDSLHLLNKDGKRVTLLLVGSGNLRKELEEKADTLGVSERVRFIDHLEQHELPAFFHHIDALVLPSVTTPRWKEQFGRVLVEAMACKVPVVGSSSGEIPNVVGDAGLIFKEGDAKELSNSLDMLIKNKERREQLARKGFQRVKERYAWSAVTKKLVKIYKRVLK